MGPPDDRNGPSHLVGCSLVPADALSLCTHTHTPMLRESIQGWPSVTSYTYLHVSLRPQMRRWGYECVKVRSAEKHVRRAAHLTGAPAVLCARPALAHPPCHALLQASLLLSMVRSLLSASHRDVCVSVMSVHLRPRPRPAGAGMVKKRQQTKWICLCEWI